MKYWRYILSESKHPENKKIICWDKDDIGFAVIDVISFTKEILPKYFRHSNFSSFVRQVHHFLWVA